MLGIFKLSFATTEMNSLDGSRKKKITNGRRKNDSTRVGPEQSCWFQYFAMQWCLLFALAWFGAHLISFTHLSGVMYMLEAC